MKKLVSYLVARMCLLISLSFSLSRRRVFLRLFLLFLFFRFCSIRFPPVHPTRRRFDVIIDVSRHSQLEKKENLKRYFNNVSIRVFNPSVALKTIKAMAVIVGRAGKKQQRLNILLAASIKREGMAGRIILSAVTQSTHV